nr:hypothetical protein [Allomuricauda sp.]
MKSIKVLGMALLGMSIIMASCSGEDGKDGLDGNNGTNGTNGTNGDPGADGLACWDTDKDGEQDPGEDINQDGSFDALDCAGNDGADGQDGSDKPNMDFYFQDGFKGYSGTQDTYINGAAIDTKYGAEDTFRASFVLNAPTVSNYGLLRFDNIHIDIWESLIADGETCQNGFFLNQATLYLYMDSYSTNNPDKVSLHLGFFGDTNDPLFVEDQADWESANDIEDWFVDGGVSQNWTGPFSGTDGYNIEMELDPNAFGRIGWIAIPLPRSLVSQWICVPESNKGMRLRLDGADTNTASVNFFSKDYNVADLRPLLVIETEDIDPAAGKMAPSSKAQDWDNMSYEEKMAPLHRYFAAKGL